ncbi:MAG TPA: transcription-repair coupling factor, partial [Chloroflexi bacterium]|nr:transcription-repair coupling factor [Chloroflexota bacterium]
GGVGASGLLAAFERLEPYRDLRAELTGGGTPSPLGLMRAARPALLAALARDLQRPMLLVTGSVDRAKSLTRSLHDWAPMDAAGSVRLLNFPEPLVTFYERAPWTEEVIADRLQALFALQPPALAAEEAAAPSPLVVLASARALMQCTLPVRQFKSTARELRVGQLLDLEQALTRWTGLGYEPVSVVEAPGQFSHRGGILDVFPPADLLPVRIELFGSQIESLRRFEPATQRSKTRVERVVITPACEALPRYGPRAAEYVAAQLARDLPADVREELEAHQRGLTSAMAFPGIEFYLPYFYSHPATLLDYLPKGGLLVIDDEISLRETWSALEKDAVEMQAAMAEGGQLPPDYPRPYLTWDEWQDGVHALPVLTLGHGATEMEEAATSLLADCFIPDEYFGGQLKAVLDHVEGAQAAGGQVLVVSQQARRLAELWGGEHAYVPPVDDLVQMPLGPLTFMKGALAEGWILRGFDLGQPFSSLYLLTDAEIFGWRRPVPRRPRPRRRKAAPETYFSDLTPGDFVVHVEHGIGVFRGLVTRAMEGISREYLLIEYAEDDRLYVPIHQADRISRYIGADARPPRIHRLGGSRWQRVKGRAQEAAEEVAEELLALYAARELAPGHPFAPDTDWQAELEASFPYIETEDQLRAIADVKADMEKSKPMDRLICGDVGYGKTEVALRAAFKAVMDGKQVAVLVPTTVLAQQHYTTFRQRLAPFPVEVEMLSRFRTRSEQQSILERLYTGQVDIVIGTHRLLQKDVMFSDLGLLVIDEEQRFGVTHKEYLKQMRTEVDVLTMTATPIPRTLYMSLTGVRDISTIDTPPEERLPVSTYTGQYDASLVQRAIRRELERGGQVFYLHNRVQTIRSVANRLRKLVPEAKFAVAHGQMRESDLEQAMLQFVVGEIDVLVCTSIIESGLDIPNANTLIVERADRFGLAQLYQLRGRVGRGSQRAYAYFFHGRVTRLTSEARQRLETMREASNLGAGYTIAMRDLEIRGAGDILGTRQSGQIAAVGFDLYTRLLSRSVKALKARRQGEPPPPEPLGSIRIDLPLAVRLPDDYVPDTRLRLQLYRRLAELGSMAQIREMEQELTDRFGPLPPSVENLMYQLRLKALARDARVDAIGVDRERLVLHSGEGNFDVTAVRRVFGRRVSTSGAKLWLPMGPDWREELIDALKRLARAIG